MIIGLSGPSSFAWLTLLDQKRAFSKARSGLRSWLISQKLLTRGCHQLQNMEGLLPGVHGGQVQYCAGGYATLGYYRCSADMLRSWEVGGVTVDILKVQFGGQDRQAVCWRARGDSRGTRRWLWAGTAHCATSSAQSFSLQISTSVRRWAALSPCAEVAPARTQRAPTAASACQATWPWPGHTTACPRQPRTQQLRSSRRAGVRLLPCTRLWDLAAQRKASRGCRCFEAPCSFPFKAHSFPTTSLYRSGLSS